ncbi:MAG: UDP-N-acetylmuramoyl-tripeptide--D-alanyl-D-alanine ligase [Bacteroidota bacterium]
MPLHTEQLFTYYQRFPRVITDSRQDLEGAIFFALRGERFDGNQFAAEALKKGAALVVVDDPVIAQQLSGQKGDFVLVEDSLAALQALARHYRRSWRMPVLAITGSNGKTTTKELIAAVMDQRYTIHATPGNYNNHIGLPLTILRAGPEVEMCILEMGANHQEEIAELCRIGEPSHGLITNIGQAHLEGFGGRAGIKKGKGELFDWLGANDGVGFVNLDEADLPELGQKLKRQVDFRTSVTPHPDVLEMEIRLVRTHPNCLVQFLSETGELLEAETHLPGQHNFQNIKAAIAVGKYFKVPGEKIAEALEHYQPTNSRSQRLSHREVNFYWDAYNANPTSTKATLSAFAEMTDGPRAAILGDMLEMGDESFNLHQEVARFALDSGLKDLILVGAEYGPVAQQLGLTHFDDSSSLSDWFWQHKWDNYLVLVKGSRGIKLERLLD